MSVDVGDKAPDFITPTSGGGEVSLQALAGSPFVLYFYPKDDTPGCTKEACGFRDALPDFSSLNVDVIGISKDTVAKHDKFTAKYDLNFRLASDEDGAVCEAFDVWKEKRMYGKTYMGIERSTFLVDGAGIVRQAWRKVRVPGHVDAVLAAVKEL